MQEHPSERHSLEYFHEHAQELTEAMRSSGQPIMLTSAGDREFVLQDAASYARMKAESEQLATMREIQEGIDSAESGDVVSADAYFDSLKSRLALLR